MCDILFMLQTNVIDDIELDREAAYKRGYAVVVRPDGHEWSISESKRAYRTWRCRQLYGVLDFGDLTGAEQAAVDEGWDSWCVVVHVPGVPVAALDHITTAQAVDDAGLPFVQFDEESGEFLPRTYRLREWWVNPASLPVEMVEVIRSEGELTVDLPTLCSLVTRIRDGAQFEAAA